MLFKCPYGNLDLVLLLLGLKGLRADLDPEHFSSGWDYWCRRKVSPDDGSVYQKRELTGLFEKTYEVEKPAPGALVIGQVIEQVPFKGWLLAQLVLDNLFNQKHPLTGLIHPPQATLDLLEQKLFPEMRGETVHTRKLTSPEDNLRFEFKSSLLIAKTPYSVNGQSYTALTVGLRRQTKTYVPGQEDNEALVMDMEILVPVFAFNADLDEVKSIADMPPPHNRLQMGLALTRGGNALGMAGGSELAGLRISAATVLLPAQTGSSETVAATQFEKPVVLVQQYGFTGEQWQNLPPDDREATITAVLEIPQVQQLLDSPLGPFTVQKFSSGAMGTLDPLKDFSGALGKVKGDFKTFTGELDDAWTDVKAIWNTGSPERPGAEKDPKVDTNTGLRHTGHLLLTLGLLAGKPKDYKLGDVGELNFWSVLAELMKEIDGFPLYLKSLQKPSADPGSVEEESPGNDATGSESGDDLFEEWDEDEDLMLDTLFFDESDDESDLWNDDDSEETPPGTDPPADTRPIKRYPTCGAFQLALVDALDGPLKKWVGLRGMAFDIPLKKGHRTDPEEKNPEREAEILLQLGKFLSGENLMNNWITRLIPGAKSARTALPGIALFPLESRIAESEGEHGGADLGLKWGFRGDLVSLGFDVRGANKAGLVKTRRFGLGGVEVRFLLNLDLKDLQQMQFAVGGAVKLKDIRLNLRPQKPATAFALEELLTAFLPFYSAEPEDGEEETLKPETRLSEKTDNKFSLTVGYRYDSVPGKIGTFDLELRDAKGKPGKTVWIPVERRLGPLYLKNMGFAISGMHALGPGKDLTKDKSAISVVATGGIRLAGFELGLIGCGIKFPLHEFKPEFLLEGLDLSFTAGEIVISGGFLKKDDFYAGHLRIKLPVVTIAAMGAYGMMPDPDDEQKEHPSLFIYGALSAEEGAGISILGIIKITGIAAGFGVNRKVVTPAVSKVADFPLVQIVMGKGSVFEPDDSDDKRRPIPGDPRSVVSEPADVNSLLPKMGDSIKPAIGANFGALGLRFSLVETIDCFALAIIQFGADPANFELNLLGLARMKLPKLTAENTATAPLCYLELQIAAALKPAEGIFRAEALISNSSWVFSKACRITGGFALYIWFAGDHEGDFVVSLGGYHPRFKRPAHYPVVPRLGLHWVVDPKLTIKGEVYLALTPSCLMAGGKLQAHYKQKNIKAWFDAYLDLLLAWNPVWFELKVGIFIGVEVKFLKTWSFSLGIELEVWGPPFGGLVTLDLAITTFTIPIGESRNAGSRLIGSWPQFGRNYIDGIESVNADRVVTAKTDDRHATGKWTVPAADKPLVNGPAMIKPQLKKGSLAEAGQERDDLWVVRADQMEIATETGVPATRLEVGQARTGGMAPLARSGENLSLLRPLEIEKGQTQTGAKVRIKPMDRDLNSTLRIAVVRDDTELGIEPVALPLDDWGVDTKTSSLPGALWDPDPAGGAKPKPEAKMVKDCIVGLKTLSPPAGRVTGELGGEVSVETLDWVEMPAQKISAIKPPAGEPDTKRDVSSSLRELGFNIPRGASTGAPVDPHGPADAPATSSLENEWGKSWRKWKSLRRK